jgi:hypothetical protein
LYGGTTLVHIQLHHKMLTMNEQPQDNEQNSTGEENRYNEDNKQKNDQQPTVNKSGVEEDTSAIYLTENSTLQSPQEFKTDKEGDHSKEDEEITVSGSDDDVSTAPSLAGDQAAALAGGEDEATNLNQGLEDQDIEKY